MIENSQIRNLLKGNTLRTYMNPTTTPRTEMFKTANPVWLNRSKTRRFFRLARIMSGELTGFGASVEQIKIDPHGRACTNGKTVWLPESMNDDERINTIMQEAVLAHEVAGHHRYTDFSVWEKQVVDKIESGDADPLLHHFVNMLEDARINHLLSQDFAGSGKRLDFAHKMFMKDHQKQTTDESEPSQQAIVAMMSEVIAYENHWFSTPEVVDFMDEVRPLMVQATKQPDTAHIVRQAIKLLAEYRKVWPVANPDTTEMPEMEDMQEVSDAAQEQRKQGNNAEKVSRTRYSDMKETDASERESKKQEAEDKESNEDSSGSADGANGEGEDGDEEGGQEGAGDSESDADGDGTGDEADGEGGAPSDGEGGSPSDSESDEEGESGSGDGESDSTESDGSKSDRLEEDGSFEESWAHLIESADADLVADVQAAIEMEANHDGEMNRIEKSVDTRTEQTNCGEHQIMVTAGAKDIASRSIDNIDRYETLYDDIARSHRQGIVQLANEVKRRVKGSDPRYDTGFRSGRVDPKQTWKLSRASQMPSDRIMMKKVTGNKPTANVMILIDSSGSMGCDVTSDKTRADCASEAAVVMSEVMNSIDFNYEIIDFNTRSGTTMRVRKAFTGRLGSIEKATISAPFTGSANSDGYAVEWCLNRLKKMQGNNFLFVISDGQPAGTCPSYHPTEDAHLISVVQNAPKGIGIISIGIGGMDTSDYYPNAIKIDNTSQLAREMLPVMRPVLRKATSRTA